MEGPRGAAPADAKTWCLRMDRTLDVSVSIRAMLASLSRSYSASAEPESAGLPPELRTVGTCIPTSEGWFCAAVGVASSAARSSEGGAASSP